MQSERKRVSESEEGEGSERKKMENGE